MSNIDEQLKNLEDAIQDVERNFTGEQQAEMPKNDTVSTTNAKLPFQKMYLIPLAVPIIVAAVLYFWKPKWVTTKKAKLNKAAFLKWVVIITVLIWAVLFLFNYCAGKGLLGKYI